MRDGNDNPWSGGNNFGGNNSGSSGNFAPNQQHPSERPLDRNDCEIIVVSKDLTYVYLINSFKINSLFLF